jgi:tRNA (guanine-N7-)-methyltransferase
MEDHPPLRSYGRIKSRPIKPRQAALMDTLLPSIRCPDAPFSPADLKPDAAEVWLEIGFGGGEHMAAQAQRRPDVLILGAEPFLNGVASALRHIDEMGLDNVRLHDSDVRALIAHLPDASLSRVFILFPDPWPKARHHKRRLIQPELLADLARVLRPGGEAFITVWNKWQPKFWFKKKDVQVPWKQKEEVLNRYYHLFSYCELSRLAKKAGFKVIKTFPESRYTFPLKYFSRNVCMLVRKPAGDLKS